MKLKWNEAVFRALGEIDDDLIPPEKPMGDRTAGEPEDKTEDRETEKPARAPRRRVFTALGTAAAVLLILTGVTLLHRLTGMGTPTAEQPQDSTEPPTQNAPAVESETDASGAREYFSYLPYLASYTDDLIPIVRVMTLPALPDADDAGQIIETGDPESSALPPLSAFVDRDGELRTVVAGAGEEDDVLLKNLRRDLGYANFTRSYGCVLWKADWSRGEAEYLGVVPIVKPDAADALLCAGEYLTAVPEEDTPELTPETLDSLVGRRTLVYLLSPAEDRIRLYECFFVRLNPEEDAAERWGLYYVPAAGGEISE